MQAYCVSKRPRRGLILGIAIALGVLGLTAALLPAFQGGGLVANATYLRLLGYMPAAAGGDLTTASTAESQEGRVLASSVRTPAATPVPPAVDVRESDGATPSDGATLAPASEDERHGKLLAMDLDAVREVNETHDAFDEDFSTFGFGVLPENAADVRGAEAIEAFAVPEDDRDGRCTWTREFEARDDDHDGNPEWAKGRMLGTCLVDEDHDGAPEAAATIAREFQVWDNDSNGQFSALEGRQGLEGYADPDEDGVYEYTVHAVFTLSAVDANEDKKPEAIMIIAKGEQAFDRDEDGNSEYVRTFEAKVCMSDAASDGTPDEVSIDMRLYHAYDIEDDATYEYEGVLTLTASVVDANNDGANESAALELRGRLGLRVEEIAAVTVWTQRGAVALDDPAPRSSEGAQYSIPYTVAAALVIVIQHRDNIVRLYTGTERKLGESVRIEGQA